MKKLLILSSVVACSSVFALDKDQYKFDAKFADPLNFNVIEANFYIVNSVDGSRVIDRENGENYRWSYNLPNKNYGTGKIEQFAIGDNTYYNGEIHPIVLINHDQVNCSNPKDATSSVIIFNSYGKLESISNVWAGSRNYVYGGEACEHLNQLDKRPLWVSKYLTLDTKMIDGFFKLDKAKEKDIAVIYNSDKYKTIRFKPTKNTLEPFAKQVHQFEYMRSVSPKGKVTYSVMNHLHVCSPAKQYTTRIDFDQNGKFIEIDEVSSKFDAALTPYCK